MSKIFNEINIYYHLLDIIANVAYIWEGMDRKKILKILREKEIVERLPIDALKLYILFLVFAGEMEGRSAIDFRTVKRAFGEGFNLDRMQEACRALEKVGLVRVNFIGIEGRESFAANGYINFMVEYKLLDP